MHVWLKDAILWDLTKFLMRCFSFSKHTLGWWDPWRLEDSRQRQAGGDEPVWSRMILLPTRGNVESLQQDQRHTEKIAMPLQLEREWKLAPLGHLPINILGDGNCFPQTVRVLTFGTDNHHAEMRVRIISEMALNFSLYTDLTLFSFQVIDRWWLRPAGVIVDVGRYTSWCFLVISSHLHWRKRSRQWLHLAPSAPCSTCLPQQMCSAFRHRACFLTKGLQSFSTWPKGPYNQRTRSEGGLKCTSCGRLIVRTS